MTDFLTRLGKAFDDFVDALTDEEDDKKEDRPGFSASAHQSAKEEAAKRWEPTSVVDAAARRQMHRDIFVRQLGRIGNSSSDSQSLNAWVSQAQRIADHGASRYRPYQEAPQ